MMSLYSPAASTGTLREVGCFNTTATALEIFLTRLTTTGTQGAGLTEARYNPKGPPALCTAFTTHSADATLGDDLGYRAVLGAAVGSGVIWTFGDSGIQIGLPDAVELVTNGIGIILETGTGQICQCYVVWDE
jgi:hypothetical protein